MEKEYDYDGYARALGVIEKVIRPERVKDWIRIIEKEDLDLHYPER